MKKFNLFLIIVAFLLGNHFLFSQAVDRLYLSSASTGRVYDITSLTGGALPTPITIPNSSGTPSNISNLAVGYDQPGGNPSTLVFINSNIAAGSTLYKNGTAISGTTIPAGVEIGGIATNNVPGPYFGNVYGFQSDTKTIYPIYPSGSAIPITSTDTDWINGTTFGTDTFFDYQNNIYTFINNGSNRYLFKISIATGVAEKAISAPISGSASFANLPTSRGIQGMAYLQGYVYIATVTASNTVEVRRINIYDGTSILSATYTGGNYQNLDLATVPYYVPFTLTCNGISQSSTTIPFVEGVASNGVRSLNIPITNVYGPGTYTINIIGENFNSSSTVNITSSTTSINVPLVYDGGGSSGTRTLSVNLNGSSTACSVNVVVEKDTDKDTIPDYQDLDSDNDGILDIFECPQSVVDVTFNVANGNSQSFSAPAADLGFIFDVYKLDNSFTLTVNGASISSSELQFQPNQTDNVRFMDGSRYGNGGIPQIYGMTGTAANPLVRIIIHKNGAISMYGSKTSRGPLFPLQLYNGNNFNTIIWNQTSANTVVVSQVVVGATYISGRGNGVRNGFCDPDNDGISNQFDVDSDNDGCPDAIEGSENVKYNQIHDLNLPLADPNYAYRGQIKVTYNGTTTSTPSGIISNSPSANGVPQLLNNAGNNLNASTNPSNLAGTVDNTDGTADIGQGIGDSQVNTINSCKCYKPAQTSGTALDTNHGITALGRAGADNSNWPMVRKGAWTALEAKTKGFVINRLTDAQISAISSADLVEGMMVYNISQDCLQINIDGTAAGWKCFNTQTCPD